LQTIKDPPGNPQEEPTKEYWHHDETEPARQERQAS